MQNLGYLVFIWVRATLPRLRGDQLMQFAWLILIRFVRVGDKEGEL